jgi:hypothetical protein
MKNLFTILLIMFSFCAVNAQTKPTPAAFSPLPPKLYKVLRDSCTQMDIVFTTGAGGSMSLEGRNVIMFSTFVAPQSIIAKKEIEKTGFIMWQKNGREFITGDIYFQSDTAGYLVFKKGEKEYINQLSTQGATFLRRQKK